MQKSHNQLELFSARSGRTREDLSEHISAASGHRVHLTFTRNRVRMASLEFQPRNRVDLRLHEDFQHAPPPVLDALCTYLRDRKDADWKVVADFAQQLPLGNGEAKSRPARPTRLRRKGEHYDLGEIYERINQRFFSGNIKCRIGWARHAPQRPRRRRRQRQSIRYGSFSEDSQTIRVNPLLDRPDVPAQFLEYIVFHEMLHAVVPSTRLNGRCNHHPPAFRQLEQAFPNLAEMKKLCRTLLDHLD